MSYCIPVLLRASVGARTFVRGDFHLGPLSLPMAWIAGLWLLITSLFLFWPSYAPVDRYSVRASRATRVLHCCSC